MEIPSLIFLFASVLNLVLLVLLFLRSKSNRNDELFALLKEIQASLDKTIRDESSRVEISLRNEFTSSRQELQAAMGSLRKEVGDSIKSANDTMVNQLLGFKDSIVLAQGEVANGQKAQLDSFATTIEQLTKSNDSRQAQLNQTIENRLNEIRTSNEGKLDEMRKTVDEKLQGTLEKRLGESFAQVSKQLEQVHQGLGEMQNLAVGVGDLKKVLTNVKTRGTWGEFQLSALLEDMLTPEQYERNVRIRPRSPEMVEFAIRLPGKEEGQEHVWLPIDSKFPKEDYERLLDAQEKGLPELAEASAKQLEISIESCARDIRDKYVHPPYSVDFGILFLPVESLFAEVLRRPGLVDRIQQTHRVTIAGPTTLTALLTSLRMGFRSLAIQKQSGEISKVLGAVKTEFGKFGGILEKAGEQLQTVQKTITLAATKTRTIGQKLKNVEALPQAEAQQLLPQEGVEESADLLLDQHEG